MGTRILPVAITEKFVQSSFGVLTTAEGSSRPVSVVTHSAGISPVEVWTFTLPYPQFRPSRRLGSGGAGASRHIGSKRGARRSLVFLPRSAASDRFQLGLLRAFPFANIFAANFLPARILRALVVLGAADKSISSRSIIVTTPSSSLT
jgi:hypothetical protein